MVGRMDMTYRPQRPITYSQSPGLAAGLPCGARILLYEILLFAGCFNVLLRSYEWWPPLAISQYLFSFPWLLWSLLSRTQIWRTDRKSEERTGRPLWATKVLLWRDCTTWSLYREWTLWRTCDCRIPKSD